jgi:hypothetical protein
MLGVRVLAEEEERYKYRMGEAKGKPGGVRLKLGGVIQSHAHISQL